MTSIGKNFGLFGNNGIGVNIKKTKDVKTDVPVAKPQVTEHKELGDELLTANTFYPGVSLSKTKHTAQKADLDDLTATVQNLNLSNVSRADKKEAFNAVQDPLVKAYMYGNINNSTMNALANLDGLGSFTEYMADDLLADVEIG